MLRKLVISQCEIESKFYTKTVVMLFRRRTLRIVGIVWLLKRISIVAVSTSLCFSWRKIEFCKFLNGMIYL